jgi:hypothetical protein
VHPGAHAHWRRTLQRHHQQLGGGLQGTYPCAVGHMGPCYSVAGADGASAAAAQVGQERASPEIPGWLPASVKHLLQACFKQDPNARPTAEQLYQVSSMALLLGWLSGHATMPPRSIRRGVTFPDMQSRRMAAE